MAEEAFLRSIVPAVSPTGHGLTEFFIIKDIYELVAGIVAALIGMNDRFRLEGDSMIFHQFVDGFQDEIHFQRWTEHVRAYSARTAHPFQRNGAPFRFKLSKAQLVD